MAPANLAAALTPPLPSPARQIALALACLLAGQLISQVVGAGLLSAFGASGPADLGALAPMQLALLVASNQCLGYLLPALAAAWMLFGDRLAGGLSLAPVPGVRRLALGVAVLAACLPLTASLAALNAQVPLPTWATDIEQQVAGVLAAVIRAEGARGLLVAVGLFAVLPAVAEELAFRGLLQPGIIRLTGSRHAGVWITGLAFGLAHVQLAGLLPRVWLGVVLGFLVAAGASLWLGILAHALFNGAQVLAVRYGEVASGVPNSEQVPLPDTLTVAWAISLAGLGLWWGLARLAPAPEREDGADEPEPGG